MALRVGLSTPWDLWDLEAEEQRERLSAIVDAGIDHLFTADHISFIDGSGLDGPVALAALAAMEPRLDVYLGVYLLALRHPMVAARQISTLAQTAPGRVTIGVGVGGEDRHEIEVVEVDPATRGRRTDAAMYLTRALLAGHTVDGDGEFYRFRQGRIRPVPDPAVPFVVGGRSDAALDRAGRLGDGWIAAWCSARRFKEGVTRVEEIGAERGPAWQHGLQVWVGVGSDRNEARQYVADGMQSFYKLGFELFERYTPFGTAQHIAEFLAPYVRAGASVINLTPCGPDRDTELGVIAEVRTLLGGGSGD